MRARSAALRIVGRRRKQLQGRRSPCAGFAHADMPILVRAAVDQVLIVVRYRTGGWQAFVAHCHSARIIDGRSCLFRQREPVEFVCSER
jgi:hypothetical protein